MIDKSLFLTYLYLLVYILLSSGVILYNKWVLSPKYFNFPFPITLTMIHMGFSGAVAFFLIRVIKVVSPVKMTFEIYATCVIPISAFFASSLWFGNTAYLHISVAFIQMLKALMPVATFLMAVVCGTDKLRWDVFLNMLLVSVGGVVSSYGEIHFNVIGTAYQVTGIFVEALRLVLTQVLLQKKGLTLNPITSLYYIAPCSGFLVNKLSAQLTSYGLCKDIWSQGNFFVVLRCRHCRNFYVEEKYYDRLRESIDLHDNFDQIDLAQKIDEKHELLEMRRVAGYIYKKASRWK